MVKHRFVFDRGFKQTFLYILPIERTLAYNRDALSPCTPTVRALRAGGGPHICEVIASLLRPTWPTSWWCDPTSSGECAGRCNHGCRKVCCFVTTGEDVRIIIPKGHILLLSSVSKVFFLLIELKLFFLHVLGP